jgi:hypothetical protein
MQPQQPVEHGLFLRRLQVVNLVKVVNFDLGR